MIRHVTLRIGYDPAVATRRGIINGLRSTTGVREVDIKEVESKEEIKWQDHFIRTD